MALTGRRQFLAGLLASGLAPRPTWADAGAPRFLSAAATANGRYMLCGIDAGLNITFMLPLPGRGHAAAAHPVRPEAVVFARRPGTFSMVIDCTTGRRKTVLNAPDGRHFYGHGAFSSDGSLLYTTENDFEAGRGRIGVWDVANGYVRIAEWDSGGIGPHDIKRLPGTEWLVVANGGIDTHPDTGRTKLNIPTMRPNLTYVEYGQVIDQAELPAELHKNSIRHLAVSSDGEVAFGMQWQGEGTPAALVGRHQVGAEVQLMQSSPAVRRALAGYVGSIAYAEDGRTIAVTSPRGGVVQRFDAETVQHTETVAMEDVCGVAPLPTGFAVTSGTGALCYLGGATLHATRHSSVMWDNHLVPI